MLRLSVTPDELIPFFGMTIGVIFIIAAAVAVVQIAKSQIGQAIARRIRGRELEGPEMQATLSELRDHLAGLERRLAESEERLDFTERLLAQHKSAGAGAGARALPAGSRSDQH